MAKSKYETHVAPYLDRIKIWVAKGATIREVADKLHTTEKSLYAWKKVHGELSEALDAPRGYVDDLVEAALFRRATGYDYEEVTRWQTIGRNGELVWLERRAQKHLPPDPGAAEFWLANRRRKEWRRMPEEKETETDNETGIVILPEVKDE